MKTRLAMLKGGAGVMRALGPEAAHRAAIRALAQGLGPKIAPVSDPVLATTLWDLRFETPIGVAAGFDKNAEAVDGIFGLGVGFTEIGGVTPRPQEGAPKPRVFRLPAERAVINRLGFNNDGLDVVAARLRARPPSDRIVGVNIGANANSVDRQADYETVLRGLWGLCAFYTVNVSSPNTARLRELQGRVALMTLLSRLREARDALAAESGRWAPLLVKIAPDLTEEEIHDIADVALAIELDGIVATNTTAARPAALRGRAARQAGGLSGAPLFALSTEVLRQTYRATSGKIPLIGVGGVATADQAYAKIRAGASLLQLYTALIYEGPGVVSEIARGLAERLRADGFASIAEAVGSGADTPIEGAPPIRRAEAS